MRMNDKLWFRFKQCCLWLLSLVLCLDGIDLGLNCWMNVSRFALTVSTLTVRDRWNCHLYRFISLRAREIPARLWREKTSRIPPRFFAPVPTCFIIWGKTFQVLMFFYVLISLPPPTHPVRSSSPSPLSPFPQTSSLLQPNQVFALSLWASLAL